MSDDNVNNIRNKCASPASAIGKDPVLGSVNTSKHANAVTNTSSESEALKLRRYYSPTIRLNVTLREPDDHSCPVFDYAKLLSQEKSKRKREREKFTQPRNETDNPAEFDDETEEEIKRLAQHFEQKYGSGANTGSNKRKKKKKAPTFYNYTELAHGYDESDSFIDNSEAFDEALPDEMETYHGGYYVNCGQLKFKKIATAATPATFASADENSDTEEIINVKKRNSVLKSSDEGSDNKENSSESSEQSESEEEQTNANATETESTHASNKRKLTIENSAMPIPCKRVELNSSKSGGEVVYNVNGDNDVEDGSFRTKHNGKVAHENNSANSLPSGVSSLAAEEQMLMTKSASTSQMINKFKRKYKKRNSIEQISSLSFQDSSTSTAVSSSKAKKKMLTVKVLLEEKRTGDSNINYASLPNDAGNNCIIGGGNGGCIVNARFEDDYVRNSISDVIESVVNAARNHSEDSRDSNFSSSDTKSIDSRTSGETEKENQTLDEMETSTNYTASDASKKLVSSFKDRDTSTKSVNFLSSLPTEVQDIISQIKLAAPRSTELGSRNVFTPLLNSKLISLETKSRALNPTCKHLIYEHVANFLPSSKESLMKRAKRLLFEEEEERVVEFLKKLKHSIDRVMQLIIVDANVKNLKKKFVFNDETRDCLGNVISCHLSYLRKLKPKKDSFEPSLKKFVDARVTPLWPEGWMNTDDLMKVIDSIGISYIRPKSKKNHVVIPSSNIVVPKKPRTPQPQNPMDSNGSIKTNVGNKTVTTSITATTATITCPSAVATSTIVNTTTAITTAANTQSITNITSRTTTATVITPTAAPTATNGVSWTNSSFEHIFANAITRAVSSSSLPTSKEPSSPPKKSQARQFSFSSVSPPPQSSQQPSVSSGGAELFKIDSIIASSGKSKTDPPPHLLNHASQYNKHYSHKGTKRKKATADESRDVRLCLGKEEKSIANMFKHCNGVDYVSRSDTSSRDNPISRINVAGSKSSVTISPVGSKPSSTSSLSSTTVSTATTTISPTSTSKEKRSKNASFEEAVLDLSPNKILIKSEPKSEASADLTSNESGSVGQSNRTSIKHISSAGDARILATCAKRPSNNDAIVNEHGFWSSPNARRSSVEIKEGEASRSIGRVNTIVNNTSSNVKTPLSRKQRILQESLARSSDSSNASNSSSPTFVESRPDAWSKMKDKEKLSSSMEEKRTALIEETTTATDILSQIINDSLRETNSSSSCNSNRFNSDASNIMSTFKNCESKEPSIVMNSAGKCEIMSKSSRDRTHRDKHVDKRPHSSTSPSHSADVTVSGSRNTSNQAEMEAADVIKELLSLNQIGGHSIPRRMDYKDTNRFSIDRSTSNSVPTSSAPSNPESSLPIESSAAAQRPIFTGFQSAFFQHLMKRDCSSDGNAPT